MERGKTSTTGRGGKSKAPQHPQDIFALGSKSTVVVSRDSEKRNIHKPSTSGVERKREQASFGTQPPSKRARIGSPAESVVTTSLDVEPVDLVYSVLQALDTHNSDKLLLLLTSSIRLLKSQRSKPDPILCMSMLYLCKIRPNMFAHETVTQSLCQLLKREQGAAFKSKGNPLVFVLACNMLYAGHKDSNNWPDTFIKVYIEDALNERWWVECSWCKCLVENIVTAFGTRQPPPHLIPSDNTLGTMSPSGSGSPLMGSTDEDADNADLDYTVFPRYSSSYETVEGLVLEAIKDQIQRRAAPDAIGKGFLKLLSATCGFPEIRVISACRLEAWLHSGKLWRCAQELLAYVCCNAAASGPAAARDHEVLAQLARIRLKTKPLQAAYQACLREMVSDSPALLRSVVTHTIYNELSNVRSPNNISVLCALIQAQPQLVPAAMATTYQELVLRAEDYLRPLRVLTRECVRGARADVAALLPLARALALPPPHEPTLEVRERAFASLADLFCCCCLVTASHSKHLAEYRQQVCAIQAAAVGWLADTAVPIYKATRHEYQQALNKIMFVESAEAYSKVDNWPPESERALTYRLCCEAPLPQTTLHRLCFIGLSKDIPVMPAEVFELVEQLVRRACALPPEDAPLQVDKLEIAEYIFQLCQFNPPDNITLPAGYTPPLLAITSLYWRAWLLVCMIAAHNAHGFASRAAHTYPTLRALIETCITGKPSLEWSACSAAEAERAEAERALVLQLETHLASASNAKLPVTEHNSRLLSQLTTLDPLGPPRKPPPSILETLQQLNSQLRLGKLLCRQPALLLELVERHGTRRAMPWLHQLLKNDQLELSVLPVQCLCEFLSAGGGGAGGGGAGGAEGGKAGELRAHLRRTAHASEEGARAVLAYYMQRLHHHHKPTRQQARRGLKLVLTQTEDSPEMDYNADVSPNEWLELLSGLRHWAAVRAEAVCRVRAACLAETAPAHVAAYIGFLAAHVAAHPQLSHTDIVLDLSQLLMERTTVMSWVLPQPEVSGPQEPQHRSLHALTQIMYQHLYKLRRSGSTEEVDEVGRWSGGERVSLQWAAGRRAALHVVVAHAHLKLLCYGPSSFDTNQEMYSWLQSAWVGSDAPQAFLMESAEEAVLLPDWLRLHLVRSARPPLLEAGLRGLPAHKLALFIQTFGMPVPAMSALLSALDGCAASAVSRLGVERGYMSQLLRVQRARGAQGGQAFAAALRLHHNALPPDEELFAPVLLPEETDDPWSAPPAPDAHRPMTLQQAGALLETIFEGANTYLEDIDTGLTQLVALVTHGVKSGGACPYVQCVLTYMSGAAAGAAAGAGVRSRRAYSAPLVRALLPVATPQIRELATSLGLCKRSQPHEPLPALPPRPTREQLIAAFEAATPSTLEALGTRVIEQLDTELIVDVIYTLLENNQDDKYENKVKSEPGAESAAAHALSRAGLGCGLLLDWLAELQREAPGTHHHKQMRLMFLRGGGAWRPQLVTLLAHRASWRTLHDTLTELLKPNGKWSARGVLEFAGTLAGSARVGRHAPHKHRAPDDTLRLDNHQVCVLVHYIVAEAREAEAVDGLEGARRCIESRLPLLLRCCAGPRALLAAALAAQDKHPLLLMLLYMKMPRIMQLVSECSEAGGGGAWAGAGAVWAACAASTSATDQVSHALLTALAALAAQPYNKDTMHKIWRLEGGVRSVFVRVCGSGARALPLCGALLRGTPAHARHHHHVLAAVEVLPDDQLFADTYRSEVNSILECFLSIVRQQSSGVAGGGNRDALAHRVAAVLRRYLATKPAHAQALLHQHHHTMQSVPALSSVCVGAAESASAAPPAHALKALQRRALPPQELLYMLQDVESWGVRRGGAWGGRATARALLRAAAPLAAHRHQPLRSAALGLLAKLLPAVHDTKPGLEAILECLDSNQPEITQSALDKLPEIIVGMQEHAARILMRVFELGVTSRHPVDTCIAKCVSTLNLHRGC